MAIRSFAASGSANLYFSPASGSVTAGQALSVKVYVNSGAAPTNAVEADFTYPASILQFSSIDTTGSAYDVDAPSSGGSGTVKIARGSYTNVSGMALIATVRFTALVAGSAPLSFVSSSQVVDSTDSTNILTSSTGATFTVTSAASAPTPTATPQSVVKATPTPIYSKGVTARTPVPSPVYPATRGTVATAASPTPRPSATPVPAGTISPSAQSPALAAPTGMLGLSRTGLSLLVLVVVLALAVTFFAFWSTLRAKLVKNRASDAPTGAATDQPATGPLPPWDGPGAAQTFYPDSKGPKE